MKGKSLFNNIINHPNFNSLKCSSPHSLRLLSLPWCYGVTIFKRFQFSQLNTVVINGCVKHVENKYLIQHFKL